MKNVPFFVGGFYWFSYKLRTPRISLSLLLSPFLLPRSPKMLQHNDFLLKEDDFYKKTSIDVLVRMQLYMPEHMCVCGRVRF